MSLRMLHNESGVLAVRAFATSGVWSPKFVRLVYLLRIRRGLCSMESKVFAASICFKSLGGPYHLGACHRLGGLLRVRGMTRVSGRLLLSSQGVATQHSKEATMELRYLGSPFLRRP